MSDSNKFLFFYDGIFSNWVPCNIVIDGIKYKSVDQYFMAMKEKYFNENNSLPQMLMNALDPNTVNTIGMNVIGKLERWEKVREEYMYEGLKAKFSLPDFKECLIRTERKEIVNVSPNDCIWGIGLSIDNPDITEKTKWQGQNLLGKLLMKVRDEWLASDHVEETKKVEEQKTEEKPKDFDLREFVIRLGKHIEEGKIIYVNGNQLEHWSDRCTLTYKFRFLDSLTFTIEIKNGNVILKLILSDSRIILSEMEVTFLLKKMDYYNEQQALNKANEPKVKSAYAIEQIEKALGIT